MVVMMLVLNGGDGGNDDRKDGCDDSDVEFWCW